MLIRCVQLKTFNVQNVNKNNLLLPVSEKKKNVNIRASLRKVFAQNVVLKCNAFLFLRKTVVITSSVELRP